MINRAKVRYAVKDNFLTMIALILIRLDWKFARMSIDYFKAM